MTNTNTDKTRRRVAKRVSEWNTFATARGWETFKLIELVRLLRSDSIGLDLGTIGTFALAEGLIVPAPGRKSYTATASGRAAAGLR